ncbi:MAG: HDOD domain-containing protein [Pseudomonadales bacterium]|nr:HDOD domain-containing protein [Pseudomonadales bacterium]
MRFVDRVIEILTSDILIFSAPEDEEDSDDSAAFMHEKELEPMSENQPKTENTPSTPQLEKSTETLLSSTQIKQDFYQSIFQANLNTLRVLQPQRLHLHELLEELITDKQARRKFMPQLSATTPKVLQCLRDESSSIEKIIKFIHKDAFISAAVLKASNSILYNPGNQRIDSFERAVVIIGRTGLKSIACTSMLKPAPQINKEDGYFEDAIYAHSQRTAIAAQLIAEPLGLNPFIAYMAGLFHNIGEVTLYHRISQDQSIAPENKACHFYYLQPFNLNKLSEEIIKQWQLSEEISDIFSNKTSAKMQKVLAKAIVLSQAIHLCKMNLIDDAAFNRIALALSVKQSLLEKIIALSDDSINAKKH